jgi:hypothetical protein
VLLTLAPTTLALFGVLYFVPLEYTAQVFTDGWSVLAAYPRLYALWLLWGLAVMAMATAAPRVGNNRSVDSQRSPQSGRIGRSIST